MEKLLRRGSSLGALSLMLLALNNCASETEKEPTQVEAPTDKATQLSVNAMVIADPPPIPVIAPPIPIIPAIPIAPVLPPPLPVFIPPPEPFLWQARLVPPIMASNVASSGQLPSRHGDRTYLYSFVNHLDRHDHRHRHDREDD